MTSLPFASLGMYDGGELTAANDALWSDVARRLEKWGLLDVPRRLDRARPLEELWSSGRLLFGQICGYPFAARFSESLRLLAVPQYAVPGCTRTGHRSFVVVNASSRVRRIDELRGTCAAINDVESMTGRHLLGDTVARSLPTPGFFASVEVTGSHAESLARVAAGDADVAAIDCVSYAHLSRSAPEVVAETRVLTRTREVPPLPFVISSACGEVAAFLVARALSEAVAEPSLEEARRVLRLASLRRSTGAAYARTLAIAARADRVFAPLSRGQRDSVRVDGAHSSAADAAASGRSRNRRHLTRALAR